MTVVKFETNERDVLLSKLKAILKPLAPDALLISSNRSGPLFAELSLQTAEPRVTSDGLARRAFWYVRDQMRISQLVWRFRGTTETYLFFTGGSLLVLPALAVRLARRHLLILCTGSAYRSVLAKETRSGSLGGMFTGFMSLVLETLSLAMAHKIGVETRALALVPPVSVFPRKTTSGVTLGVDIELFRPLKPLRKRRFSAGFVGRLSPEKNVESLVKALAKMNDRDAMYVIVGDGELGPEVGNLVRERGLEDQIMMTGWMSPSRMPEVLNDIRILVIPSITEGLPNIALEAMASGTPILASPVGGIVDLVRDGQSGFLVHDLSDVGLANALTKILRQQNLELVAEEARHEVRARYSIETAQSNLARFIGLDSPRNT